MLEPRTRFEVKHLSPALGTLVSDMNLSAASPEQVADLLDLLAKRLVLFFEDQDLDPESLLTVASRFGTPVPYPFVDGLPGFPSVVEVRKLPGETRNFGGVWHSDTAYLESPAMGALLYALEVPPVGGDTLFSNMYSAYETLSPGLRRFLGKRRAVNDADKPQIAATRQTHLKKGPKATHPVVRTHPVTGRQLLFLNRAHTTHFEGMTIAESRPLLDFLFNLQIREEFTCRFSWRPGSLAFWDNRACQHYPLNDYPGESRRMLRVSLAGSKPL